MRPVKVSPPIACRVAKRQDSWMGVPGASSDRMDRPSFPDRGAGEPVLGLQLGVVRLREYTPLWAELFLTEAGHIRAALRELALDVQHVGSTAVPGMRAKPILDIAVAVPAIADAAKCTPPLADLGYQHARWVDLEDDVVFEKGIERTHHLHIVERKGRQWSDYIRFRDALRNDARLAAEYECIKRELGGRFRDNRAAYTCAKGEFIRRVLSVA